MFDVCNVFFMLLLMFATLYPFWYVLIASISEPGWIAMTRGMIWLPHGFNLASYKAVFSNPIIQSGYMNTLFVVIVGTALNMIMTSFGAYALSRQHVMLKNAIMFMIVFTMFFGGGLIPSYILVTSLGMLDSLWALIIPVAVGSFNLIIMRTAFQAVPVSLEESARLDGANDFTILFRVVLPLSLPVVAVMILFYGVSHWNSWFGALIYLRHREQYPLQLILREILISNSTDSMTVDSGGDKLQVAMTIKYATIIVATGPILLLYPYLQKFFVKGVMIGAIKE
ncbi:carbohydrate ABC transporter permease [Paenibacillus flagellatus]|uniref:Sugar ABC transporter permease n=1 Tax=Paenibacillus flagellatus TaxID=2211139 RepID=A0A2V5KBK7_9BACL|nr:sugar ABC transporter permease [Paenibacillus flagellatus]